MTEIISRYFPEFTQYQIDTFEKAIILYKEWNLKINVISRKDMDNLQIHHIIHALSIAKFIQFKPGTTVLDVGTGGGFPGIPLAIAFPEVKFTLMDSIAKKIRVVEEISTALRLTNVDTLVTRIEKHYSTYDFITARAVTNLPDFIHATSKNISTTNINKLPNGIIYLKGGDFDEELTSIPLLYQIKRISDYFNEDFFETKKLIHLYPLR